MSPFLLTPQFFGRGLVWLDPESGILVRPVTLDEYAGFRDWAEMTVRSLIGGQPLVALLTGDRGPHDEHIRGLVPDWEAQAQVRVSSGSLVQGWGAPMAPSPRPRPVPVQMTTDRVSFVWIEKIGNDVGIRLCIGRKHPERNALAPKWENLTLSRWCTETGYNPDVFQGTAA